jgi:hypothetical protein
VSCPAAAGSRCSSVLMVALHERPPDADKLLPPASQPGSGERRRRSLREVVGDRRIGREEKQTLVASAVSQMLKMPAKLILADLPASHLRLKP